MKKYINSLLAITTLSLFFIACKKDEAVTQQVSIQAPVISKLNRGYVQAGDTLVIYGAALLQNQRTTEVFINDRPCELLKATADSLQVKVPVKTRSGAVKVTISYGRQFNSVSSNILEVKPTPLIKSFWPMYAYAGETITLVMENFSINNADNHIFLGTDPVQITGGNGIDTFQVVLPASARTGQFSWRTYQGPLLYMSDTFPIRQSSYPVTTVMGWLQQDPGFRYIDTLMWGYPILGGSNFHDYYKRGYDSAVRYLNNSDRSYTVFLPADMAYYNKGISFTDYIDNIKNKPSIYYLPMVADIVPDRQLSLANMHDGDIYNTAFTMQMQYYPDGSTEYRNTMLVTEENGEKYVNLLGIYGETNPRVKILREHKIGNVTLIETDGELGYIPF